MKIFNYLDLVLNLNDRSYRPYKKANEETNYVHVNSEHPTSEVNRKTVIIFIIV